MLNTENTMSNTTLTQLQEGLTTAYIDGTAAANLAYKPAFVSNNPDEGKKVISVIEDELMKCDQFQISVAFITMGGITPLLQTLKELEKRQIPGQILTTNYLNFSEPRALKKLQELSNVTLKMYDVDRADQGFHTKGYIFKKEEIYRIIIGSANITSAALTKNKEWNTKIVSTEQGEIAMEIVKEFHQLWDSKYALFYDDFYENYKQKYEIIKKQREIAKRDEISSTEKYKLEPNSMQVGFITNLRKIVDAGENRALLISATGTGKTYASAFAMRELGFKRVLFLVHRSTLAKQALTSFRKVFEDKKSMGIVGAGYSDYDADYIFAMVETLHKEDNLRKFAPEEFDCIVLDEAHHSPANTYQKVMEYFKPKLFLGMTATPDKRDDGEASKNVYELFHYQIAYEIRLQQAMEEDLLCPFHYFGISDISVVTDEQMKTRNISEENFGKLTSDERVRHVIEQAKYYGYSGDRVKGLVFCSRNRECEELSAKFNALGYRTIALSGDNKDKEREKAFERLAMNEEDATDEMQPLDYIFSVDILNEGVDIVEVNQVIMLRPTQSPIVFIQQLGRGLRKAENKEYVVILDFIGNYNNNFMIPVALSGDRTYNADTIRKYVISGNNTIPGASTVHFDEIAKEKIFNSIDKIKGMRSIIKGSYISLKNRIGRTPLLFDFYEQGEIDPLVIIREYKTYWQFLEAVEKGKYFSKLTDHEKLILDYLSKTILSGVRPSELFLLQKLLTKKTFSVNEVQKELKRLLDYNITDLEMRESVKILQGCFTSKDEEYQKYKTIEIMDYDEKQGVRCFASYANCLLDNEFNTQVKDIINVGLARYRDKYAHGKVEQTPFVLYEKYSRRDVSLLMNCGKDMSSTMYGMSRIGDDVFIFITYHKEEAEEGKNYADGKPDYADAFEDNLIFKWDSQIGKDNSSPYMQKVLTAPRKHLLVKKSDAESSFYYMGQFDIIESVDSQKEDNSGKMKPIAKVTMKMHHPVREDLLRYLQSNISKENKAV
jgi:superfamily II DNA or RNA helicase